MQKHPTQILPFAASIRPLPSFVDPVTIRGGRERERRFLALTWFLIQSLLRESLQSLKLCLLSHRSFRSLGELRRRISRAGAKRTRSNFRNLAKFSARSIDSALQLS